MNQATPLGVDLYTRYMVGMFDERDIIGVSTGFQTMFGRPSTGGLTLFSPDSSVVDVEILRGNRRISTLVKRGMSTRMIDSKKVSGESQAMLTRLYPLINEEWPIDASQLLTRGAGESPYQKKTKIERLRELAVRSHKNCMRRIIGRFEAMAAQSILTGKMDAVVGTSDSTLQYDFQRNGDNTITVNTAWDNSGSIMSDIEGACDVVRINGKVNPDFMVVGREAMKALIADSSMKERADNRRYNLVLVGNTGMSVTGPQMPSKFSPMIDAGFQLRGLMETDAGYVLWLFSYLDSYDHDDDGDTPYMPVDQCLIGSTQARCDRYFGPSEVLPLTSERITCYQEFFGFNPTAAPMPPNVANMAAVINPAMFYTDAYVNGNFTSITSRTQAAPIFAPTMVDAFATLKGLITP